jgi:hypothetical protein
MSGYKASDMVIKGRGDVRKDSIADVAGLLGRTTSKDERRQNVVSQTSQESARLRSANSFLQISQRINHNKEVEVLNSLETC